ncbi:MAG: hypothetical protein IPM57_01040 [Oligoflexia bacterium]|nr:hypothetical protein [Oligoflexia bacterium]
MRKSILTLIFIFGFSAVAEAQWFKSDKWYSSWSGIKAKVMSYFKKDEPAQQQVEPKIEVLKAESIMEESTKQNWTNNIQEVKRQEVVVKAKPAVITNDKNLVMGRNNIPVFEFKKYEAKKIKLKNVIFVPLLDVGEEATLDPYAYKVVNLEKFPNAKIKTIQVLQGPEKIKEAEVKNLIKNTVFHLVQKTEKIIIPELEEDKKVTKEKIEKIVFNPQLEEKIVLLSIEPLNDEDLKMLRAMILYEKKDYCHIASGIFYDLLKSEKPQIKSDSRYFLATCLKHMNLPTSAITEYLKLIKAQDTKHTNESVQSILAIHQLHNQDSIAETLLNYSENIDELNYIKAKYYYNKNQFQQALNNSLKVKEGAKNYFKAQYIAAISEYLIGKKEQSESRSKENIQKLIKQDSSANDAKEVLALFNVHLGRLSFQKGKFKDSLNSYKNISKDNSLWLQALTEQGWAQIQAKDPAGAIGNMHSIQSPYFEAVYKPESYIVRGIGYLNICQYPDAFKAITILEQKYTPWLQQMQSYLKRNDAQKTYSTVIKHLESKKNIDIDGLSYQVVKEIARQRDFLNKLMSYNALLDEDGHFNNIKTLIEKDKRALTSRRNQAITKIVTLKNKIKTAATTPGAIKNLNQWKMELTQYEDFLATYDFKMDTYKEGEEGLKTYTQSAKDNLYRQRAVYKEQAGKLLKSHLAKITKELKKSLENNELLKYEIYAGSGENIRYQVAGGKQKISKKSKDDRDIASQNWDFKGEFWEDEIGNYRSSLKNNCKEK